MRTIPSIRRLCATSLASINLRTTGRRTGAAQTTTSSGSSITIPTPNMIPRAASRDRGGDAFDQVSLVEVDLLTDLVIGGGPGHGLAHLGLGHDLVGLDRTDVGDEVGAGAHNLHVR